MRPQAHDRTFRHKRAMFRIIAIPVHRNPQIRGRTALTEAKRSSDESAEKIRISSDLSLTLWKRHHFRILGSECSPFSSFQTGCKVFSLLCGRERQAVFPAKGIDSVAHEVALLRHPRSPVVACDFLNYIFHVFLHAPPRGGAADCCRVSRPRLIGWQDSFGRLPRPFRSRLRSHPLLPGSLFRAGSFATSFRPRGVRIRRTGRS